MQNLSDTCNWCCTLFRDCKVEDEWLLTERELTTLTSKYKHLVQFMKIDTDMLIRMSHSGCITQQQMSYLRNKQVPIKRNRAMVDILKRRSLRSYHQFVDCLKQTGCNTIAASILEHDEGEAPFSYTLF